MIEFVSWLGAILQACSDIVCCVHVLSLDFYDAWPSYIFLPNLLKFYAILIYHPRLLFTLLVLSWTRTRFSLTWFCSYLNSHILNHYFFVPLKCDHIYNTPLGSSAIIYIPLMVEMCTYEFCHEMHTNLHPSLWHVKIVSSPVCLSTFTIGLTWLFMKLWASNYFDPWRSGFCGLSQLLFDTISSRTVP